MTKIKVEWSSTNQTYDPPMEFSGNYETREDEVWWRQIELYLTEIDDTERPLGYLTDFLSKAYDLHLEGMTVEVEHEPGSGDFSCQYGFVLRGWRLATTEEASAAMLMVKERAAQKEHWARIERQRARVVLGLPEEE